MSPLLFQQGGKRARVGLKGPCAEDWLRAQGMAPPLMPNSWTESGWSGSADDGLLIARLGASEFFLEDRATPGRAAPSGADAAVRRLASALQAPLIGVYPVLREDGAFLLSGAGALDVFAQVCNVNFAALDLDARPVIMTMMIGVSVLIVPQTAGIAVQYRIWCDPTFAPYLDESIGKVVIDCGGSHGGMSA